MPKKTFATRIENKHGGGVPDVHILWDGIPFWFELKVAKYERVKVSPHQVAWHMAYFARGGLSFFLVKHPSSRSIFLFEGNKGPELVEKSLFEVQGTRFESPASLFEGLRPRLVEHISATLRACDPAS